MPDEFISNKQARYDGMADWYDAYNDHAAQLNAPRLAELLGPGTGLCLDLGCGTGYFDAIRSAGRTPIGLDYSADQRRLAVHPTYRTFGWHEPPPWWAPNGIRGQAGVRHLPLMDLFNGFIEAG